MTQTLSNEVIAPYIVVRYAWELIKRNTNITEANYGGKVPFSPLGEEPSISDVARPYFVYTFSESPTRDGFCQYGNMGIAVYADTMRQTGQLVNILNQAFMREDESAKDINAYSSTVPFYHGIRFGTVSTVFVEGNQPVEIEGGAVMASVAIRYEYFTEYDIKTSFAEYVNGSYVITAP